MVTRFESDFGLGDTLIAVVLGALLVKNYKWWTYVVAVSISCLKALVTMVRVRVNEFEADRIATERENEIRDICEKAMADERVAWQSIKDTLISVLEEEISDREREKGEWASEKEDWERQIASWQAEKDDFEMQIALWRSENEGMVSERAREREGWRREREGWEGERESVGGGRELICFFSWRWR
ncbi:hypothetical protein ACP275_14G082900 [Erythranthe tilingii]